MKFLIWLLSLTDQLLAYAELASSGAAKREEARMSILMEAIEQEERCEENISLLSYHGGKKELL